MRRIVELSLRLPEGWFPLPLEAETDLVEWASDTAYSAWRRRADAGVPEEAVGPDAGRRLVVELAGLAQNVREQLGAGAPGASHASVWVPVPELGIVSAVVIAQVAARSAERSPERFAEALEEVVSAPTPGAGHLHAQRLESELGGAPVRGLHTMTGLMDPEAGVAALEERTCFGVFPEGCEDMAEVLFVAERPAAFEDMPQQTLAMLEGLELAVADAA